MKYEITITETIYRKCTAVVEAGTEDEAFDIAEEKYIDGDYNEDFEYVTLYGADGYNIDVVEI